MSMIVVLVDEKTEVRLNTEAALRLETLGITHVAMLRDRQTVAIVLEGWAFDPDRSAPEAANLLAADGLPVRILRPVARTSLAPRSASPPNRS